MSHVGVYIRIRHRFGARILEWFLAWVTMAWGCSLLLPADTFAGGRGWVIFSAIWPEAAWGTLMATLGAARLIGLYVNGSRQDVTPWIRAITAGVGCAIWIGISFAFGLSGVISPWLAIYPSFAVAELINVYRATHDAGESDGPS